MNYLFFDVECANSFDGVGKICEFGYVLTDENLNVLKHGIHLINPNAEFQDYVIWHIISYKVEDYYNAPKYPEVYHEHIKDLLELPNTICLGHGIKNDIKYLNDEANRYGLAKIDFQYIDTSYIYKAFYGEEKIKGLKAIVKEKELGNHKSLHNSEYDSLMTLEYVKLLCMESALSFSDLSNKYHSVRIAQIDRYNQSSPRKASQLKKKDFRSDKSTNHMIRGKKNHSMFRLFIERGEPIGEKSDKLVGKKVTVSMNYEAEHFKEMVILAGLIKAAGGEYEIKASNCDLFATFEKIDKEGIPFHCNRYDYVNEAIKNGKNIEITSLDELLTLLDTDRETLETTQPLDIDYVLDEKFRKFINV